MNLWFLLGLVIAAIYVGGFVTLVYCAKHAPEGYEDVDGFHVGPKAGAAKSAPLPCEPSVADALKQATWQTAAPF